MSYKLTYTGQQVQDYLDKVATGQVGGTSDYDTLENRPIINADLDNTAANTADQTVLYHHVGESTATYKKAALYYTNGTSWLQFKGEKGADGDTGLTALEYGNVHTEGYEGDIADEPISFAINDFNRTPVIGDKFLLVFNVTESGSTYVATFTITEVSTTTAKAIVNVETIVKISVEGLPKVTAEDVGKFLRVNSNGNWVAEAVPSAEGASV